jgi:Domain of Unknown Function (DUF748)
MENHNSEDNHKLRRIRRLRWIWVIVGCGVLAALILISMPFGMDYAIERYFLTHGADEAVVGDVDFNLITRRLVLKKVIVIVANEQVLNVSEAGFTIAWAPFFKKRFLIEKIDLSDSDITIEESPEGRWRIGGLLPEPSVGRTTASAWGFGLAELQVKNSQVKFRSPQLTSELQIEQARLSRLRSWLPDQNTRMEFKGQLNDGKLQFQGDFSPFGSGPIVDGSVKLNGLTLTPFAQLIAADPSTLQGRLDADVGIQGKFSSGKGFSFSQTGRLELNQARMRFGDVELADEYFTWNGTVRVKLPAASEALQIAVAGQLKGQGGSVNAAPDKLAFQHNGLDWNGKFVLDRKPETADLNFDGALTVQKFKMAAPELNLAEENFSGDGNVQIKIPNSPDELMITAAGQMAGKGAFLDSPSANFKLQGSGLNWNGKFAFAAKQQTADTKLDGDLAFAKLEVATSDALLAEENLTWNGSLQIFLPENGETQRLTTNGKLESRHQTIAFLRENLGLANGNLLWKGQFNCGLKDFSAGFAAEGDFSLTDLAITATQERLQLLASKAVNLKSIKGDADSQFSVATAKITGLDLIGETGAPENASLFSASEVTVDNVKLERHKQVSIQSVRIVAAKGVLHHKNDGRWLYIDDLTTFLTDSSSSAKRKSLQNKTAEKIQSSAKEEDIGFGIRIGSLEIAGDSVLHFEDETVSPTFSTDVRLEEARLTGVDSFQPEQSSPFTLEASSRKYTRLKLQGHVQPFRKRISLDFKGKIKAAEIPPLSPYAVKTLGYSLISGEMDADIDLKIIMGRMEGEGDLKFYKPEIEAVDPQKFKNEEGKPIPLQSALTVLRDNDNDVRLKIPISGDVTDPKFSFSDAINQALIKGLSMATLSYLKYMLGPYGMAVGIIELGVKIGAKALPGIRLKPVEFQPGASEIDPAAMEYIGKVAAILKEKKDLRLKLCGWAIESDRMSRSEATPRPAAPSGPESLETKSAPGRQSAAQKELRFPVTDEVMLRLAQQRADLIKDILVSHYDIKNKRIFICQPEIDKNPEARPRVELVF